MQATGRANFLVADRNGGWNLPQGFPRCAIVPATGRLVCRARAKQHLPGKDIQAGEEDALPSTTGMLFRKAGFRNVTTTMQECGRINDGCWWYRTNASSGCRGLTGSTSSIAFTFQPWQSKAFVFGDATLGFRFGFCDVFFLARTTFGFGFCDVFLFGRRGFRFGCRFRFRSVAETEMSIEVEVIRQVLQQIATFAL